MGSLSVLMYAECVTSLLTAWCFLSLAGCGSSEGLYGVENAYFAVIQLAQTTMRSELGKISLDKTFEERAALNANIVSSIQ